MRVQQISPYKGDIPLELGDLVSFTLANKLQGHPEYKDVFYMNEDGNVVWNTYKLSLSITEPISTSVFKVIK